MTKTIMIEGMSCGHCVGSVEKALNAIAGVSAKVDLKGKKAVCTLKNDVPDKVLSDAVTDAGFEVISIA